MDTGSLTPLWWFLGVSLPLAAAIVFGLAVWARRNGFTIIRLVLPKEEPYYVASSLTEEASKEVAPEAEDEQVFVQIKEGWVSMDLQKFITMPASSVMFSKLIETKHDWQDSCTTAWFTGIHFRTKAFCVKLALEMRAKRVEDKQVDIKRRATASAIIFEFPLPQSLWLYDYESAMIVLKYLVLTQSVKVDVRKLTLQEFVKVGNLQERIDKLVALPVFMNSFAAQSRPPSFDALYAHMVATKEMAPNEEYIFKKILSCVYLTAGICIPLDYLYVDIEVSDYVLKNDDYDPMYLKNEKVTQKSR